MAVKNKCGLCGATKKLTQTDCCKNWICDDVDQYRMFSYAKNSCSRNHDRYTLCSSHRHEGHKGNWQTCKKCLSNYDTEDYVYYGTNDFNFEKLSVVPSFPPTICADCSKVIVRSEEGYSIRGNNFYCENCGNSFLTQRLAEIDNSPIEEKSQNSKKTPTPSLKSKSTPLNLLIPNNVKWVELYTQAIPGNWGATRIRRFLEVDSGITLKAENAYVFFNKAKDKLKLYSHDGDSEIYLIKELEKGGFMMPLAEASQLFIKVSAQKLPSLLRS